MLEALCARISSLDSWISKPFIEFVFVETSQLFSSNPNVILTRQTCGQLSGMTAASKRRVLVFDFSTLICYMVPFSKCRGEWDLDLCTTLGLAKRMLLRSGEFWRILRPNPFKHRKSVPRSRILFASPGVMHRPRSDYPLHFDIRIIYCSKFVRKLENKMLIQPVPT